MSLSRYYRNSDSFQPEEIVKLDGDRGPAWKPLPRSEDRAFAAGSLLTEDDLPAGPAKQASPPSPASAAPKVSQAPDPTPPRSDPQKSPSPPKEKIDLSNYIDISTAEQQKKQAYQQGIEKGRAEERRKADEESRRAEEDLAAAGRALLQACKQLDTLRETLIANSSREIIDFILAISERIVRTMVQEQDATIVATIEEALRQAVRSEEFAIFLHPGDYDAVAAKASDIVAGISGLNNIVLRKDKTIERGGAKIESDNCTIDATISGQFEIIREEVRKKL